jgi:hypothetical protein
MRAIQQHASRLPPPPDSWHRKPWHNTESNTRPLTMNSVTTLMTSHNTGNHGLTLKVYPGGGDLWNGMIAPLLPSTTRGSIWYHGEARCSSRSSTPPPPFLSNGPVGQTVWYQGEARCSGLNSILQRPLASGIHDGAGVEAQPS